MARRIARPLVDDTPTEILIAGKTYLVSQMTLGAQFALQRAAKEHIPPPTIRDRDAQAFLDALGPGLEALLERYGSSVAGLDEKKAQAHLVNLRAQAKALVQDALRESLASFEEWPGQVGTAEMSEAFMNTEEGLRLVVKFALLPHQPALTDEDLARIVDTLTLPQAERLFAAFMPPAREEEQTGPLGLHGGGNGTSTPSTGTPSTAPSPATTRAGPSSPSIA